MPVRTAARRATAALLCAVVIVALGLALLAAPDSPSAPTSLSVALDFDTFVPGVSQSRTSVVDVPVPSEVLEAGIVHVRGDAARIDVDLEMCDARRCRPLTAGSELEPGKYTLNVTANLDGEADTTSAVAGSFAGQIRIVETRRQAMVEPQTLMMVAGGAFALIAIGALGIRPRREVLT